MLTADLNLVRTTRISEQKEFDGQLFPLVLTANEDALPTLGSAVQWVRTHRAALEAQLLQYGAVLMRGFPLEGAQDFDQLVAAFGTEPLPYVGGAAPRKQITDKVFTANEAPPDQLIPFHHEMAQVPTFPSILYFFCDIAPSQAGQTPLVLSNRVYQQMLEKHPQFVRDLEDKHVVYTRVLPDGDDPDSPIGRGWQSTYQTEDKAEAERKCQQQGTSFEWLDNGCLKTVTAALPAIREDVRTGKKMWFNSIIAAFRGWRDSRNTPEKAITFADGSPMPPAVMDDLEHILNELAVDVTWEKGDIIIVDNRQVLHARRPFTPPRRILASLAK